MVDLQFMKAGTSDALVLNSISRQAFDSDVFCANLSLRRGAKNCQETK